MTVRCPLPLQDPWSPAGYRVVQVADEIVAQVADEQAPAAQARSRANRSGEGPKHTQPPRAPSSPLGYRVQQVAEETVPPDPRAPAPKARSAERPPRARGLDLLGVLDVLAPRPRSVERPPPLWYL
jgi:hypothetical protein